MLLAAATMCQAESLVVKQGDTLKTQIQAQAGKKITIRLQSGEDMTGTVKSVTNELLQLGDLAGKEFFYAVIDLSRINAIIVRTK
jgi:hypothetical protein